MMLFGEIYKLCDITIIIILGANLSGIVFCVRMTMSKCGLSLIKHSLMSVVVSVDVCVYMGVWRTRLLNCYYFWCSFYCFQLIDFDRYICFYLPVSLLAIRLLCFNKLELSWECKLRAGYVLCLWAMLPDSKINGNGMPASLRLISETN